MAILWSIVPAASAKTALELTLLSAALLPMVSVTGPEPGFDPGYGRDLDLVLDVLVVAILCGAVVATIDIALYDRYGPLAAPGHYTAHRVVKYNRGISYLEMMLWPLLACCWLHRSKAVAIGLAVAVSVVTVVSASLTAKIALAAGFAVLALSLVSVTATGAMMAGGVVVLGVATPVMLKVASALLLAEPLSLIKRSGLHRLEFWDYMADRVWDRPLLGWGWQSVPALPIHPEELARYHVVDDQGVGHAHNMWLQVWVETGVVGAVLFLAFALYALHRTVTLPEPLRPFALACYATVLTMTLSAYNLSADSWWAAIAWSAFLFILVANRWRTTAAGSR
jgi:O-antigen ligase